jgi:hypothetical protein
LASGQVAIGANGDIFVGSAAFSSAVQKFGPTGTALGSPLLTIDTGLLPQPLLGFAMHNHHATHNKFPSGAIAKEYDYAPATPWTFYRWSALAQLTPFLEQSNVYNSLDLTKPLYSVTFAVTPYYGWHHLRQFRNENRCDPRWLIQYDCFAAS